MVEPASSHIREYTEADADATLAIFTAAVMETAAADYSPEQLWVWARPGERDRTGWHGAMSGRDSFVAVAGAKVVGFSDVSSSGFIDMLFVDPAWGGRGVARALLAEAEGRARATGAGELAADVSITARPVFERLGFEAERPQEVVRDGVALTNFRMRKTL
ncbi:putative acetyltransferase [Leucobacter komagatae]|uniref:Putative acetyltransferase n=1 Tax=Leucobacter komagatae TaxID=55969 RepID=A0A542Y689_9MICO|nr:GNAT family N-acetyltransferase [Leucobacter komagatae]TQL43554.1 putative acetyltransferase [Leucobacter komagatae]